MKNKSEEELSEIIQTPIDEETLYGSLKKPAELIELQKIVEKNKLDLYALGFYLNTWMPFLPQPVDMITFASTGVDGTYFAFLTDFKSNIDLAAAPIVVYSSGGLEFGGHTYSPVLFARSFQDFLTLCCQFPNPAVIFEDDPRVSSFDMEFLEMLSDEDELEEHHEVAKQIKKHFGLPEVINPNHYFSKFYEERNGASYIKTNDPLNIYFPGIGKADSPQLTEKVAPSELERHLEESDLFNRLKAYRDYPNFFSDFSSQEFLDMMEILIRYLEKDGFDREAEVLKVNWKKEKAYQLLHKMK